MRFFNLIPTVLYTLYASYTVSAAVLPYNPAPFLLNGYITGATVNNASDVLSGGTITVNGYTVVIPRNLLVNLPSVTAVAWGELFKPDGTIDLPLWPEVAWEASITANIFGTQHIAGVIYIFQELGHIAQGFITAIDYETGAMTIGGHPDVPNSGQRVILNDPVGRFGKVHADWPLWTTDTDNPSVAAITGYPMCVPRVAPSVGDDPLCPARNRPTDGNGTPVSLFTFPAPPVAANQPDPNLMAPLRINDFVTYSATLVPDEDGNGRVWAAYALEANIGFYTSPGTKPAYVKIVDMIFGITGNFGGEFADVRVEGFSTDITATIQVFALDVDPCTGETSERLWGSAVTQANDPIGRWRWRPAADSITFAPATREVLVRSAGGTMTTGNGLIAGQFISPWSPEGLIWPEVDIIGSNQIPFEFNLLPFLVSGSGPWLGGIPGRPKAETGPVVGQLSPWPGVGNPPLRNCPVIDPQLPVANAGPDFTAIRGNAVTLVGGITNKVVPTDPFTFAWTQTSGPTVTLNNAGSANATFTAPEVVSLTALVFSLSTTNTHGTTTDSIIVTISPGGADVISITGASWRSGGGSGILTVNAFTNNPSSTLFVSAPTIATIAMTSLGNGLFSSSIAVRPMPATVTVTSTFGGSATIAVIRG